MNRHLLLMTALLVSASMNLSAQRGGGAAGPGRVAAPTTRPNVPRNSNRYWRSRSDSRDYNGYYDGYWASDVYDLDYHNDIRQNDDPVPHAGLVVPALEPAAPPAAPVTPVLRESSWPESDSNSAAAFAIVLKDGTLHRAIAMWVQDDSLCFTDPQGIGRTLALNEINRQATVQANAELKLKLPMPMGE